MNKTILACTNPSCVDYGKEQLTIEYNFCPKCGSKLIKVFDTVTAFRSFEGITLGKTNIYDIDTNDYFKDDQSPFGSFNTIIVYDANINDGEPIEYIAKQSDRKIFCYYVPNLSSIRSPKLWEKIGVKTNDFMVSLEKVLGKEDFEMEAFQDSLHGTSIIACKQIATNSYLAIVFCEESILVSLCTKEMISQFRENLLGFT